MDVQETLQYIVSSFILAFIVALGIVVYFHNRKSWVNRLFAVFLLNIGTWALLGAVYMYLPGRFSPAVGVPVQMAVGSFLGIEFFFFSRALADDGFRFRKLDVLYFLPSLYIVAVSLCRIFVPGVAAAFAQKISVVDHHLLRQTDANYVIYSLIYVAGFGGGLVHLAANIRRQTDTSDKRRMVFIFTAVLVGATVSFGVNNLVNLLGGKIDPTDSFYVLWITITGIGISIMRHKAWKVEHLMEIIRKNEAELAERNKTIESELDLARLVQKRLLPAASPRIPGITVDFYYYPMDKVGGDFYDYHCSPDNLGVILADVCGHGIPGAFLATVSKMGFQYFAENSANGRDLMINLDRLIAERTVKSMFVTALYAKFDVRSMSVRFTNCGHCFPLVYGANRPSVVVPASVGRPLGASFGLEPVEKEVQLCHGDRILLYTDGIVETMNESDEEFGDDRLQTFLRENYLLPSGEFARKLFESLRRFAGTDDKIDDISLAVVDVA